MATFAAVFVTLFAAHQVADHWVQTQRQACDKGMPDWRGRLACLAHVTSYTLTALVALLATAAVTDLPLPAWQTAAGLAISAGSHYVIDRRALLIRLADLLKKDPAWVRDGGGAYALDQSWHYGWLWIAALVIAL